MIQAVLSNSKHPEYGVATIPFPIPETQYNHCIELLRALEIGDVLKRDCRVDEFHGAWPILKRLEEVAINVDELDYLAKRLDSFDCNELAKFQAVAVTRGYFDIADLINLTFCCQETTIIQNFTDLDAIGQAHYMDTHGGTMVGKPNIDFRHDALCLILNEDGKVTPYGVMYGPVEKADPESVWEQFRFRNVGDGHPPSISDIIELYDAGGSQFYYIDQTQLRTISFGAEVPIQSSAMQMNY